MRMADTTVTIDERFRGPGGPGHGGYFCGVLAELVPSIRRVRLDKSIPLGLRLRVLTEGESVKVVHDDGGCLIAHSEPPRIDINDVPDPPSDEVASTAPRCFERPEGHPFPECFGCGQDRIEGDGLRLFPRNVDPPDSPRHLNATRWQPHPAFLDSSGYLPTRFIWTALDCPGGWAIPGDIRTGTLQVEIFHRVDGRSPLIVTGWVRVSASSSAQSRQRYAGTAMFDLSGRLLARGDSIWVVPRKDNDSAARQCTPRPQ